MADGETVSLSWSWVPSIDLTLSLNLGGVGLLLALMVSGIGTLIVIYAIGYMGHSPMANRLICFLYLFMFAMLGVATADHLILLFVFWELTSITSYLLIGFNHEDPKSRKNALQALVVTGLGGMALLAGFILLWLITGSWSVAEINTLGDEVRGHALYLPMLILFLLGVFTKSAQFPFHFWLPNAMSAPTPVSAYLHSATMVKAGVFAMALFSPALAGTTFWYGALTIIGSITLIVGCVFGLRETDLKKILAGTTVAVLGALTVLLGMGTEKAIYAAMLFMLAHGLYKATLFMAAGSIDHETGTRERALLSGLFKVMPWTGAAAIIAACSKMGFPPLIGFLGKEYTYKASLAEPYALVLTCVFIVGNALMFALAIRAGIQPFLGKESDKLPKHPHEAPWTMRVGPVLLAAGSLLLVFMPAVFNPLITEAANAVAGFTTKTEIKLWHGFNLPLILPLILSGITIALGSFVYFFYEKRSLDGALFRLPRAEDGYHTLFNGTIQIAKWQTRILQSGILRNYILIILVSTLTLITWNLWKYWELDPFEFSKLRSPLVPVIGAAMVIAAIYAAISKSRIGALVSLGLVGYGVAMIFAVYSAPDLAITQILVETLSVVLFAWLIFGLPVGKRFSSKRTLVTDAVISTVAGGLVTVLVLKSNMLTLADSISGTLADWSLPKAYGSNVVNVILVDFRALDTMGEIIVLAIAALGVFALLGGLKKNPSQETSS